MRVLFLLITIVGLSACSSKFTEINSFGGGTTYSATSKKQGNVQAKTEERTEEKLKLDIETVNNPTSIEPTEIKPSLSNNPRHKSSKIPHNKTTKNAKKTTNFLHKIESKNLDFWVKKENPMYTNVSIVLGLICLAIVIGIILEIGLGKLIQKLTDPLSDKSTEILLWLILGFVQLGFGSWMKKVVNDEAHGKGFVVALHFIITLILSSIAILLGMF